MRNLLVLFLSYAALLAQEKGAFPPKTSASSKLTNKDIVLMHRAGLNDEVISEKVRTSACDFDTSPTALADLKPAGVSDSLVVEMIRCESRGGPKEESPTADAYGHLAD